MFGPFHVAASIRTRVVVERTSERAPPMMPAIEVGPSASSMTQHVGVEHALDVVERRHPLPRPRTAHDEPPARDEVGVERVHGLAGEEHHEVRDVHDVVDRPLPRRHEACLQPRRRLRDGHVLEQARGEAGAELRSLDLDVEAGHRVALGMWIVRPRRRDERRLRGGMHLAREAVDAEAVGTVRRDLELEHVGGDGQHVGQRRAGLQRLGQDHDALVIGADRELVLGEDHPVGLDPAQLRALELRAVGHDRAGRRDGDRLARRHVGRAAHDRGRLACADVDDAHGQAIRVGVALGRQDATDAEVLQRRDAVRVDAVDLRAGHRQPLAELLRGQAGIAEVVEPEERQPHPNCSRNRRSLSKNSRRSLTPCLRKVPSTRPPAPMPRRPTTANQSEGARRP